MATDTEKGEFRLLDIPQELINRGRDMAGKGHDVWLAGLGAFAAIEEEGTEMFNTLVKRGKKLEDTGKKRIGKVRDDAEEKQRAVVRKVEDSIYEPLLGAMRRFGVPTRAEIRELTSKVDMLTRRVDVLVSRLPKEGATVATAYAVYYVVLHDDGWAVRKEGLEPPLVVAPTKDEAIERARELAHADMPSRLHVYKKDGNIQETFTYEG